MSSSWDTVRLRIERRSSLMDEAAREVNERRFLPAGGLRDRFEQLRPIPAHTDYTLLSTTKRGGLICTDFSPETEEQPDSQPGARANRRRRPGAVGNHVGKEAPFTAVPSEGCRTIAAMPSRKKSTGNADAAAAAIENGRGPAEFPAGRKKERSMSTGRARSRTRASDHPDPRDQDEIEAGTKPPRRSAGAGRRGGTHGK
jgi:hypothetical protein